MSVNNFTEKLINWYNVNKRDLPWRSSRDPYLIWVSEIILQQTQIKQGLPYYEKFIKAFPRVDDLANSSSDKLMNIWQGLGYYSRAQNMHKTAKIVVDTYAGKFPRKYDVSLKNCYSICSHKYTNLLIYVSCISFYSVGDMIGITFVFSVHAQLGSGQACIDTNPDRKFCAMPGMRIWPWLRDVT